jgi:hypothetical protein
MAAISRRNILQFSGALALAGAPRGAGAAPSRRPAVLTFYYPGHHRDPRNDAWLGEGWTEWPTIAAARPRFPGHQQPKRPSWGNFDEADPHWSAREIALAADHGLDGFIFNHYWYEGRPFLNRALDGGFLQADNRSRMRFAVMLTNYDWTEIFPASAEGPHRIFASGTLTQAQFAGWVDHVIARYLRHPQYLRIDGALYLGFYDVDTLARGLGGLEVLGDTLTALRAKVATLGLGAVHINACSPGLAALAKDGRSGQEVAALLGIDSITAYSWAADFAFPPGGFPTADYGRAARGAAAEWVRDAAKYGAICLPTVAMGWDPSARTQQGVPYRAGGYPWLPILTGNTPAAYRRALIAARNFAQQSGAPVVMLNAWNEWSEGSYLLPERATGTAYLSAVRRVFGRAR